MPLPLRDGYEPRPGDRGWREERLATFGTSVILADDLRKPAFGENRHVRKPSHSSRARGESTTYIELVAIYIFQVDGHRVPPGLCLVDVANPMGCQIDLAILVVGQLVFAMGESGCVSLATMSGFRSQGAGSDLPLVQPHIILDEQQVFIW